ncbi:MAG: HemK2/MTQ2 family protein methyltransferase [Nitrososphaerales archaeon]
MTSKEADNIYSPAEDTFLLIKAIRRYAADRVLEIGIGSGLVLSELVEKNNLAVGVDLDIQAVKSAKDSISNKPAWSKVNLVRCDSASPFRDGAFDLVVFNPPYLPSEEIMDTTVDGGSGGVEVSMAWFREASRCLGKGGKIVFVASSLSDVEGLFEYVRGFGFGVEVLSRARLFFEELSVVEARLI